MRTTYTRFALLAAILLFVGAGCFSLTDDSSGNTSGPAGMFVSTDRGESWQQVSNLLTNEGVQSLSSVNVHRLFDDPQDPKAFYWASRAKGMFYTYDEGRSWQSAGGPLASGFIYGIQVHPENKCLIIGTNGSRVYRSNDCNRSWEEIHKEDRSKARITSLMIDPFGNHDMYMTKINGDVLRSVDGGDNWRVIQTFGAELQALVPDQVQAGTYYLASRQNGLYRTTDSGNTWDHLKDPLDEFADADEFRRIHTHPSKAKTLYWISTYGILRSTDGGDSWGQIKLITSPGSVDIFGFAIDQNDDRIMYYTTFKDGRSTFYRSMDAGETWSTHKLPTGQIPTFLRTNPDNGSIVYAGFTIPPK